MAEEPVDWTVPPIIHEYVVAAEAFMTTGLLAIEIVVSAGLIETLAGTEICVVS